MLSTVEFSVDPCELSDIASKLIGNLLTIGSKKLKTAPVPNLCTGKYSK